MVIENSKVTIQILPFLLKISFDKQKNKKKSKSKAGNEMKKIKKRNLRKKEID